MRISLIHKHRSTREILARALKVKLGAEVTDYSCVEDWLAYPQDSEVFVVYRDLGRAMSGPRAVAYIRSKRPSAFIVGVSAMPYADREFLPAGANVFLLKAGNEIAELVEILKKRLS